MVHLPPSDSDSSLDTSTSSSSTSFLAPDEARWREIEEKSNEMEAAGAFNNLDPARIEEFKAELAKNSDFEPDLKVIGSGHPVDCEMALLGAADYQRRSGEANERVRLILSHIKQRMIEEAVKAEKEWEMAEAEADEDPTIFTKEYACKVAKTLALCGAVTLVLWGIWVVANASNTSSIH